MIIWVASYPRSGNTLLRTMLFQTMGLKSHVELPPALRDENSERGTDLHKFVGTTPSSPDEWSELIARASKSAETFFFKTHEPPLDDSPVLHVVRDGRQACISYFHFLRDRFPEAQKTLLDIIAGNDLFSHWSRHFNEWASHPQRLMVRYEDLIEPSPETLQEIAAFVGHKGEINKWENPFSLLHDLKPDIFRKGENSRNYPPEWDDSVEWLFQLLHGNLNRALGYEETNKNPKITDSILKAYASFIDTTGLHFRSQQREINRLRELT